MDQAKIGAFLKELRKENDLSQEQLAERLIIKTATRQHVWQFSILCKNYSSEIAPVGQEPAQEPQEMQLSASISNLPSPSEIAPTGQEPAQAPQDTQLSPITNAITLSSFMKYVVAYW